MAEGDSTQVVFYGLHGLAGRTVAVFCVGLDCGDFVVDANERVTVPFGSDTDGLFTLARIVSVSAEAINWRALAVRVDLYNAAVLTTYTIPVAIGFPYTSRGQVLRPAIADEMKLREGSGQGKVRRVHQIAALVDGTVGVSFGTDFDNLYPAIFRTAGETPLTKAVMFSGVYRDVLQDGYGYDGMVCWEITRPYPATIVSLSGFMRTEEQ